MKKLKFALLVAFATIFCLSFTACSDDDDNNIGSKEDLIGLWESRHCRGWEKEDGRIVDEWDEDYRDKRWEFKADGTCITSERSSNRWYSETCTYTFSGGKITLYDKYGDSSVGTVKKLTATSLEIEAKGTFYDDGVKYEEYDYWTIEKISNGND